ncbi:hypothetical protein [Bradyrhizobium sp. S3.5.5]|uniref:hypothetical protein n=1 Tax=Bradyrhizobium sp. S3.5.5 TaxID=3156430 RepID=UPI0033981A05
MAKKAKAKKSKAKKAKKVAKKASAAAGRPDAGLKSAIEDHAEALREHAYELRRNSLALRAALPNVVDAEVADTGLIREAAVVGRSSPDTIRRRLASATGNNPEALKDDFKVIWMLSGGPAIRDNLMSRINNEFWPGAEVPHLRFNDIKGLTIGLLIAKIRGMI